MRPTMPIFAIAALPRPPAAHRQDHPVLAARTTAQRYLAASSGVPISLRCVQRSARPSVRVPTRFQQRYQTRSPIIAALRAATLLTTVLTRRRSGTIRLIRLPPRYATIDFLYEERHIHGSY